MKNQAKNIEYKITENVRDSMGALSDNRLAHKIKEPDGMNFVKRKQNRELPHPKRRGKAKKLLLYAGIGVKIVCATLIYEC